jgi:hypothetical protein
MVKQSTKLFFSAVLAAILLLLGLSKVFFLEGKTLEYGIAYILILTLLSFYGLINFKQISGKLALKFVALVFLFGSIWIYLAFDRCFWQVGILALIFAILNCPCCSSCSKSKCCSQDAGKNLDKNVKVELKEKIKPLSNKKTAKKVVKKTQVPPKPKRA